MASHKKRKNLYPGQEKAEQQRSIPAQPYDDDEPDSFGIAPNYDKFTRMGWTVEKVLSWFNID